MSAGPVRIGTRGSTLALWQANWVADRLRAVLDGRAVQVVTVATRGDSHMGPFTGAVGEIGFFTSEIEAAVHSGDVDVAVHSLKDLPASQEARVPVVAVPLRHDARDVLVGRGGATLDDLEDGARVGTSSPRRTCLIRSRRPELNVAPIRGNVDTRVRKVEDGEYDAVVLAAAGLDRLGLTGLVSERFDPADFPPAPGQGALAVQARADDRALSEVLRRLDDPNARRTTTAERVCLEELGGGCARPIGAYATISGGRLELHAFVGSDDGARVLRAQGAGDDPGAVGRAVAMELWTMGAEDLLS